MMLNKFNILNIIVIVVLGSFFYSTIGLKGVQPDNISNQISQREPWLRETSKSISEYMDYDESTTTIFSPGNIFLSLYTSSSFSIEKLEGLKNYLKEMGWSELPNGNHKDLSKSTVAESNKRSFDKVIVLCNNNATILIWMENPKDNNEITSIDPSTIIRLIYDAKLPCYTKNKVT